MIDKDEESHQLKRSFSMASSSTSLVSDSNCTSNSSSVGTMVGPGSLAGKAIYKLGKITLKGVEQVAIYRRLSAISFHFPHQNSSYANGIEQMYNDLPNMYSNGIRFQAISMIMAQVGSRNTKHLLSALNHHPVIEIGLLIADIVSHFNPISLTFLDVSKDPILKSYMESLCEGEEDSFSPLLDFLSQVISLDESHCGALLANGVLDLMLGLYVTDFQDFLVSRHPPPSPVKSSVLGACNSLFMVVLIKGPSGLESIQRHAVSCLWPFHPALRFLPDAEYRRYRRKLYWDLASRDCIRWRMSAIHNTMVDTSSVVDADTLLDAVMDCLAFNISVDEETSFRGLRILYTIMSREDKPFGLATAAYSYLSKIEKLDMVSTLKRIADLLSGLLSPASRAIEFFCLEHDPPDLFPDALAVFTNFFASLARRDEEYHQLVSQTGIIWISTEILTMLENMKLENEELIAISEVLDHKREDLEIYSGTYGATEDQAFPIHSVRWNLIILKKWVPGRRLLVPPIGRWPKGGPVYYHF
ncbi:hypothetical protein L218DRAFT_996874 [Marasmius fiardii PR-910]|nr:hypothetical protein L218DRAFT_996874 [Marasmius fiardii PR-910]